MTVKHNKLVRDRIPEIIAAKGGVPVVETLSESDYSLSLNQKLLEEVHEFLESGELEELADIGEVMHAILALRGVSVEEFQRVRMKKRDERGGFEKRLLLVEAAE